MKKLLCLIFSFCFLALLCLSTSAQGAVSFLSREQQLQDIAVEAYIYFYPLVTMDVTRRQLSNVEVGKMIARAPMNTFAQVREYPTPDLKVVVRPNFDTLYSSAWLDLRRGPLVLSVPDTAGRYYLLPMLDMWTDVFAVVGKRTTGTKAGKFVIAGPDYHGILPTGSIVAPTPFVWIIGRTQTNGAKDYSAVHKVQDGYTLAYLNKQTVKTKFTPDTSVDMKTPPLQQINSMPVAEYFQYATKLLKVNPPHVTDQPILSRMKRLGINAGSTFDFVKADPAVQEAMKDAPARALALMKARMNYLSPSVNGWQTDAGSIGVYGTYYLKRAIIAMAGLGANLPEDAIYPLNVGDSEGNALTGTNKYVMHFAKEELPPVDAFWSITLYDTDGFAIANKLNRFALGSSDNLHFNADGSLEIYVQQENPGEDKDSNWLPAPAGPFNLTMRLYSPAPAALEGGWNPPVVKKAE